jgi:hypothetical protein
MNDELDDELRVIAYGFILRKFSRKQIRKMLAMAEEALATGNFWALDEALAPVMPTGFDMLPVDRAGKHFDYILEAMKIRLKGKA